jgi:3-deoxy-7-phosphoheptulonate synthase
LDSETKRTCGATGVTADLSLLRRRWAGYEDPTRTYRVGVAGVEIGGPDRIVIAGPCAVESYEQTLTIAEVARAAGCRLMRGGAYKPRTDPSSFQGLGPQGLEILAEVRRKTGLGIVSEVLDPRLVEQVATVADMLQVGSRSMQNFPLLAEVGRSSVPVLLKRGWSATLNEWLCAAEYIARQGNREIVLCERGIRTSFSWSHSQTALDLDVIEPLRQATPLPILVDPSHATEDWTQVPGLCRAAMDAGAHGLLVEMLEPGADRSRVRCDAHRGVPSELLAEIVKSVQGSEPGPARRDAHHDAVAREEVAVDIETNRGATQ